MPPGDKRLAASETCAPQTQFRPPPVKCCRRFRGSMAIDFVAKCNELAVICQNNSAAAAAGPRIAQIMSIFIEGSCCEDDSNRFHCRRTCCNVVAVLLQSKLVTLAQVLKPMFHRLCKASLPPSVRAGLSALLLDVMCRCKSRVIRHAEHVLPKLKVALSHCTPAARGGGSSSDISAAYEACANIVAAHEVVVQSPHFGKVWGELAIMFISLLSSVYPQAASPSPQDAAAADTSPLKHALFSLFSQVLDVYGSAALASHTLMRALAAACWDADRGPAAAAEALRSKIFDAACGGSWKDSIGKGGKTTAEWKGMLFAFRALKADFSALMQEVEQLTSDA